MVLNSAPVAPVFSQGETYYTTHTHFDAQLLFRHVILPLEQLGPRLGQSDVLAYQPQRFLRLARPHMNVMLACSYIFVIHQHLNTMCA